MKFHPKIEFEGYSALEKWGLKKIIGCENIEIRGEKFIELKIIKFIFKKFIFSFGV